MKLFLAAAAAVVFLNNAVVFGAPVPGAIKTKVINGDRQEIGEATVMETPSGVLIRLDLQSRPAKLTPGAHAVHVHEAGQCEPPFQSAGAHWNPAGTKHGFLDRSGAHGGDLPNLHVPQSGPLTVEMLLPGAALSSGSKPMSDGDGFAIVIHQKADDYRTDPAGDSGDRIACAAIPGSGPVK